MAKVPPAKKPVHPLFRRLKKLGKREVEQFSAWLAAGVFTERKGLGETLQQALSGCSGDQKLPPPRQLTQLSRELERFLAVQSLLRDGPEERRFTARGFANHNDLSGANRQLGKARKILAAKPLQGPFDYTKNWLLQQEAQEQRSAGAAIGLDDIQADAAALDRLFLLNRLQQSCRLAAYNELHKTEERLSFREEVLTEAATAHRWQNDTLIQLYTSAYRALTEAEDSHRAVFTDQLFANPAHLADATLRDLYLSLLNVSIRRMNTGTPAAIRVCFDLFRLGLDQEVLLLNGRLSGQTFTNATLTALKLKEMKWLEEFLDGFRERLSPRDQQSIYPYCLANYHYENGDLAAATNLLANFDYAAAAATMQLQVRVTLAKVYFDDGAADLLDSHLSSLAVFLSRHKELGYHREIVLSFTRLCLRLLRLPPDLSHTRRAKLEEEIDALPVVSFTDWLRDRLPW